MAADAGIIKTDFETDKMFNSGNLVPVVAQDADSGKVLMLAYCNRESLRLTLDTGYAHYYSRSRGKLWKKGESSGNVQRIAAVYADCDGDALLYIVQQSGPACHTGEISCFFNRIK